MKIIIEAEVDMAACDWAIKSPGVLQQTVDRHMLGALAKARDDLTYAIGPKAVVKQFTLRIE